MPIYEYRCENGHQFEVIQRMADDPVETCEECGAPVERVFHPVAVHFKGSGFYTTDYAKKSQVGAGAGKEGDSGSSDSSDSKGDSGSKSDSGSSESKSGDSGSKSGDSGSKTSGEKAKSSSSKSD
jgi:putative FmdB family regulatory protein